MDRKLTAVLHRSKAVYRRLKMWDAPGMREDGYVPQGQFMFIRVVQFNEQDIYIGDVSANNVGPTLSHTDMLRIYDLQPYNDNFTQEQKIDWLTCGGEDDWGCIMRVIGGGDWRKAQSVKMVGALWAGNIVEVLEHRTFTLNYNGKTEANVPMSRIRTFTQADWGKTFQSDPHLVHSVQAAGRDAIPFRPKGTIYLPLIFKYASVWVFDRWTTAIL